jgi:hypothetical protein
MVAAGAGGESEASPGLSTMVAAGMGGESAALMVNL